MNSMTIDDKINEVETRLVNEAKKLSKMDYHETYHTACSNEDTIEGLWMEFGVFRGRTITTIAKNTDKTVYGFDSFEGLPEDWDPDNPKGKFSLNGRVPDGVIDGMDISAFDSKESKTKPWEENIKLIKGWFDDSLPPFVTEHKDEKVAYLHIDSDLYSAAKTILDNLKDQIVDGSLLLFDEINEYPNYKDHEIKAFAEFLLETGLDYEPLYYQLIEPYNNGNYGYAQGCFRIIDNRKK